MFYFIGKAVVYMQYRLSLNRLLVFSLLVWLLLVWVFVSPFDHRARDPITGMTMLIGACIITLLWVLWKLLRARTDF